MRGAVRLIEQQTGQRHDLVLAEGASLDGLLAMVEAEFGPGPWRLHARGSGRAVQGIDDVLGQVVFLTRNGPDEDDHGPRMIVREMPDDNSCLFHAMRYLVDQEADIHGLRQTIADYLLSRGGFDAALLGREPRDYAQWIVQEDSWGGGIELAIFSEVYQVQIASIDVQSLRMDVFGEDRDYPARVYLLYRGIHYDALALSCGPGRAKKDLTRFPIADRESEQMARELARQARAAHQYTDPVHFTLRCEQCGAGLVGERAAEEHAEGTGHVNFAEYDQ